ncbi:hypothetical protein G6F29_010648 [Rhizopus arrhizus]|uniref:Pentacotripeptide-repeat region of PRORP domain-containing protein n=1 Tax=Rhizopus oryzae TaxID=64495 RepID=A0A9P7BLP6_RHIOR|nr:hypothetical protein G6F23_009422 [Rhizopus arrhizus]KAG1404241.1 hypothetical protein G6F58_010218 [Rhizopus delemar]KAG0758263.1 hypothetical protein G6F24_009913 [Rhizopus arrhizus]KAG0784279.1 hypothetical protein G6F22_008373 [Rhizopus arrhizus]KAG0786677.1 hypothetical protein G6F21_008427 [Rhizopus arrhizus]
MYGAKATSAIFNTVARQGVLTKQLTAPKSTAFLSQIPARHVSGKISYTTTSRSTQFSQKSAQHNQEQQTLDDNSHASLHPSLRTGPWTTVGSHAGKTLLDPAQIDVRILQAAKEKNSRAVISTFVQGRSSGDLALSTQTYEAVIEAYGKLRKHNQPLTPMMEAYKHMVASGVRPSSQTYALLIRSLCTRDSEVQRTMGMLRRQVARTGNAVDSLVDLENEKNMEQALALFEQAVNEKCTQDFDVDLYNRMLQNLSFKGNTESGIYILQQLEGAGHAKPNGVTFATLLAMFGVAGDLPAVRECFMEYISLKNKLPSHDPAYVYNALVSAYVDAGDLDGALNIVQNVMVRDKVNVSILPYNKIFRRACYDGKMDVAESLLQKLESDPSLPKPNGSTYAAILSAYIRANDLESASKIYERLLKQDISKEYGHMADYAYACTSNNQPDVALKVIQDMVQGGLKLDATLGEKVVENFISNGKINEAIQSYHTVMDLYARDHFVDKNSSLSVFGLDFTARCNDLGQALDVLEILRKYSVGPNPVVSDALLNMYKETKTNPDQWDQISKRLSKMTFSVLYDAVFRRQSVPEEFCKTSLELLNDMHAVGILPTPSLYIRVLTRMKKYGAATEYEARWKEEFAPHLNASDNSPQPTESHISSSQDTPETASVSANSPPRMTVESDMLSGKALAKTLEGDYEKAISILKHDIINNGSIPTPDAIRDMIQGCTKAGRLDVVSEIYDTAIGSIKRLEKHNKQRALSTIYNAMLIAHARLSGLESAKVFYDEIRRIGAFPTGDAYGTLLQHSPHTDNEDCTEALAIYDEAKKNKVAPSVFFYNVVISKLAKARRLDDVLKMFEEMRQVGISPNSVTYSTVISAALRCGQDELAVQYFKEMSASPRYRPRPGPYASLIQFYAQQKPDKEKAFHYYHLAKQHKLKLPDHTEIMLKENIEQQQ